MGILFLILTVIGGITFIATGVQVLGANCAAVSIGHSGGARVGAFNITCLDESQATSSDIPAWVGGWGSILVGVLLVTSFFWLPRLLWLFSSERNQYKPPPAPPVPAAEGGDSVGAPLSRNRKTIYWIAGAALVLLLGGSMLVALIGAQNAGKSAESVTATPGQGSTLTAAEYALRACDDSGGPAVPDETAVAAFKEKRYSEIADFFTGKVTDAATAAQLDPKYERLATSAAGLSQFWAYLAKSWDVADGTDYSTQVEQFRPSATTYFTECAAVKRLNPTTPN